MSLTSDVTHEVNHPPTCTSIYHSQGALKVFFCINLSHTAADGGKDGKDATGDEKSSSHHTAADGKGEEGKYSVSELRANAEILLVADNPHA